MAEEEGQGDLKMIENQPYDLEVVLNQDEEEDNLEQNPNRHEPEEPAEQENYQEVHVPPPVLKALPKFDISSFESLAPSEEARDLLNMMKT